MHLLGVTLDYSNGRIECQDGPLLAIELASELVLCGLALDFLLCGTRLIDPQATKDFLYS